MSADFWLPVIFAFFFGVLIGWLLLRRTADKAPQAEASSAPQDKIGVIEAELKNAKRLLAANDADTISAAEALTGLETAITRTNERLKLIVKAVKGAKFSD